MPSDLQNPRDSGGLTGEDVKAANLNFFLLDRLYPAVEEVNKIGWLPEIRANYSSVALLESFLWLHLGVRIDYFPRALSRRVMYEHFGPMLGAYERVLATRDR